MVKRDLESLGHESIATTQIYLDANLAINSIPRSSVMAIL
jgi:hypothetical protein